MTLIDKTESLSAHTPDTTFLTEAGRKNLSISVSIGLVVFATFACAATPILAKLAYAHGATPATVTLFRFVIGAVIFFGLWRLNPSPLNLTRAIIVIGFVLGALYVVRALGYLSAITLIPVSIAVVVVYLYPSLVALLAKMVDGVHIGAVQTLCIAGAVLGVALATGSAPQNLNLFGLVLAFAAAASTAIVIYFGGKLCRTVGSVPSCMLAFISAAILITAWTIAFSDVGLPTAPMGWVGVVGSGLAFTIGILSFFTALKVLDAVKATIIGNMEPLFAIMLSYVALGETLSAIQFAGVVFVLVSVIVPNLSMLRDTPST